MMRAYVCWVVCFWLSGSSFIFANVVHKTEEQGEPVLRSENGRITVPLLKGAGWQCGESKDTILRSATTLMCVRVDKEELLYLFATEYEVPPEDTLPARILVEKIFLDIYREMYPSVRVISTSKIVRNGYPGYEIVLHTFGTPIQNEQAGTPLFCRRTQLLAKGTRVFHVGMEGHCDLVQNDQADIKTFFDKTWFRYAVPIMEEL